MVRQFAIRVLERARIARGISVRGFYAQTLRPGELALDIGAMLGTHTAAMLGAGARVVAVEPQAGLARDLTARLPAATVLALGVTDRAGRARLLTSSDHAELSTLNPAWAAEHAGYAEWDGEEEIRLTTVDDLIAEFGLPAFIKIDTEGLEDKVLAGLSQPVEQLLFEVHAPLPDVARRAFERLAALGSYEYRVMERQSWVFGPPLTAATILADLPSYGDVHARLRHGR